jgi:hypothetical protein
MAELHHREAVVNPSGASSIADVIVGEIRGLDDRTSAEVRRLRMDMQDRDRELPIRLRDAALLMV